MGKFNSTRFLLDRYGIAPKPHNSTRQSDDRGPSETVVQIENQFRPAGREFKHEVEVGILQSPAVPFREFDRRKLLHLVHGEGVVRKRFFLDTVSKSGTGLAIDYEGSTPNAQIPLGNGLVPLIFQRAAAASTGDKLHSAVSRGSG